MRQNEPKNRLATGIKSEMRPLFQCLEKAGINDKKVSKVWKRTGQQAVFQSIENAIIHRVF
jgi:hypothetical protein